MDSQSVLNKLSEKAKSHASIYAEFTAKLVDKQSGLDQTQRGNIKLKGEQYALRLDNYEIYSNGEDITTYSKDTNEATTDYLEDVEDGSLSPSKIFTIWEQDFKHEMISDDVQVNGAKSYHINLYPIDAKDKPFHTIQLFVDAAKLEVTEVIVKGKDGTVMTYSIGTFETTKSFKAEEFEFNEATHPGVIVVDNRL